MADPVMYPAIAGSEIKSTRMPSRMRPMRMRMMPENKERQTAISGPVISGWVSLTCVMACPTSRDTTATCTMLESVSVCALKNLLIGPMLMSFDVPKKQ